LFYVYPMVTLCLGQNAWTVTLPGYGEYNIDSLS
jgi:hypothetical protein